MFLLYLTAIFVICLSTYSFYAVNYSKKPNDNNDNDKSENQEMKNILDKISHIEQEGFEKLQSYIKEPTENINKITNLLDSLKESYSNIVEKTKPPLDDISYLKEYLQNIKTSVSKLSNEELQTLIKNVQVELQGLKNINEDIPDKLNKVEQGVEALRNLNLPESCVAPVRNLITAIDKCVEQIKTDVQNVQQLLNTIKEINESESVKNINKLQEILKLSTNINTKIVELIPTVNELKTAIPSVDPALLTTIEDKIKSLNEKHSSLLSSITAIENLLSGVKSKIEDLQCLSTESILTKVNEVSQSVQEIKNVKSESNEKIKTNHNLLLDVSKNCSVLNEIKSKIETIPDSTELDKIKTSAEKLDGKFDKVMKFLSMGAHNLIYDCVIVFKNDSGSDLNITIKAGLYTIQSLQDTIRNSLFKNKESFKIHTVGNKVVVEDPNHKFHLGNHLRTLLGIEKLESNDKVFLTKYIAQNKHNFDNVWLETLTHKNSVDSIVRKLKSSVINQIKIIDGIPPKYQTIESFLARNKSQYETIEKHLEQYKPTKDTADTWKYIKDNHSRPDMENVIDLLVKLSELSEELRKYLKVDKKKDITLDILISKIESGLSNSISTKLITDFKTSVPVLTQGDLNQPFDVLTEALTIRLNNFNTELQSGLDVFGNKLDAAIQLAHTRIEDRMNEIERLIKNSKRIRND